jgi:hypothetical protein
MFQVYIVWARMASSAHLTCLCFLFQGHGFLFGQHNNYRDVELLGDCDDGVFKLCSLLGWSDELQTLIDSANGNRAVMSTTTLTTDAAMDVALAALPTPSGEEEKGGDANDIAPITATLDSIHIM